MIPVVVEPERMTLAFPLHRKAVAAANSAIGGSSRVPEPVPPAECASAQSLMRVLGRLFGRCDAFVHVEALDWR